MNRILLIVVLVPLPEAAHHSRAEFHFGRFGQ